MKKLLLFLSLSATNIVCGVELESINEILVTIDGLVEINNRGKITNKEEIQNVLPNLVNKLLNASSDHISSSNHNSDSIEPIVEVVETIIEHVARVKERKQFLSYKKFFNYLICHGAGAVFSSFCVAYPTTKLTSKNFFAFYAALIINYHIFIEDNMVERALPSNLAKSIIDNKLYNIAFNKFTRDVIGISAEKIHIKFGNLSAHNRINGRNLWAHWETAIAPVLKEIDRLISKGLKYKENDQDSRHGSQQKKMAIVNFVALGALGCSTYYISEKTEQGKELKKWARENPKKAAAIGSLLALIVGKAAITSFASLINQ